MFRLELEIKDKVQVLFIGIWLPAQAYLANELCAHFLCEEMNKPINGYLMRGRMVE